MIIRTVMAVEPIDSTRIIGTYEHDGKQGHSEDQTEQQEHKQSKERQLQNQIYMENSVLPDVGHNINMYV